MRARIQFSQPFRLPRLVGGARPFDDWAKRIDAGKSRARWRAVRLVDWDDEDVADYGTPLWHVFPYNVAYHHDQILFSRQAAMDDPVVAELDALFRPFFAEFGLNLTATQFHQYYVGEGVGSADVAYIFESFDPAVLTDEFTRRLEIHRDEHLWKWMQKIPLFELERAGALRRIDPALPPAAVTDTNGAGIVLQGGERDLADAHEALLRAAHTFTANQPVEYDHLDPDLRVCASGMGQYFAATTSPQAELRICQLWSLGVMVWDAIGDLGHRGSGLLQISKALKGELTLKRVDEVLRALDVAEQQLIFFRGLGDPSRLSANEFEKAVYSPIWRQGGSSTLVDIAESEIERLRHLFENKLRQRDQLNQRRLSIALYLLAVLGAISAVGEIVGAASAFSDASESEASRITLISQGSIIVAGLLGGAFIFRR